MDPFATLGLPPVYPLDRDELERRYRDLQRALHPDRFTGAPPAERRMALGKVIEVNEAYRVLRDDLQRAEALVSLRGGSTEREATNPDLLMTVMELREALSDAKAARDMDAVRKLAARVEIDEQRVKATLATKLADTRCSTATLTALVNELKYYRRFLDEVAVIEDEATARPDATSNKV